MVILYLSLACWVITIVIVGSVYQVTRRSVNYIFPSSGVCQVWLQSCSPRYRCRYSKSREGVSVVEDPVAEQVVPKCGVAPGFG